VNDLLCIDLSTGRSREETLSADLLHDYIGGKGVGSHLLLEEVGADVDPLGPQNKMIFSIGPMTGTAMPGSNRCAAYFLSPLTGGYCESYSGGKLAPQFAATGYKMVILEGASNTPVYLEISEQGVTIHPADHLWGLDTYAAEEELLKRTDAAKAQACVIGPAGEKLVRFALVANNKWRCLGRGGSGAVMGSKKVKGIVWHGTQKVEVARPADFKALLKDMVERGKSDPGVARYKAMNAVVGTQYSPGQLADLANRIVGETHEFNRRRGFGARHERLPEWITEHPLTSTTGETWSLTTDEVQLMRREYYAARSWGEPTQ